MFKQTLIFSFVHITALLLCTYVFLMLQTDRTSSDQVFETRTEAALAVTVKILSTPGRIIKNMWPSHIALGFVEWFVFIGNSLFWGVAMAFAYRKVKNAT